MNKLMLLVLTLALFNCKSQEARKPITTKTGSFIDESIARNKALNAREYASIEKIMKQNDNHYLTSEHGFWYYYNTKTEADSLATPAFGDIINYDYNVKSLNGQLIYSKNDLKNQDYVVDKEELFSGLREGLKLMKPGETVTFIFPSQKAYGYYGDEYKIGRNEPLICEVTLNSISQNQTN
ncbi:gliding motility-associated peptidyl-prolyl isomerase GldI [Gaetbulibacter aestuarii]|uniref:Peptidyl-prolyl cis-trans isomerase n=1 Tax=Gaetbulibacter aestuarii TaxID=1502358 RepID=A0ABW7MZV4_9FLAO